MFSRYIKSLCLGLLCVSWSQISAQSEQLLKSLPMNDISQMQEIAKKSVEILKRTEDEKRAGLVELYGFLDTECKRRAETQKQKETCESGKLDAASLQKLDEKHIEFQHSMLKLSLGRLIGPYSENQAGH